MSEFAPRPGGPQFVGGPPVIPGVDLGGDPNQPTKRDQMRMAALSTVAQLVAAGKVDLPSTTAGQKLVDHAKVVYEFLSKG